MSREVAAILLAWALVLPVELWFGASGFVPLEPWRIGAEAAQLLILGANHARFAPAGWSRSPLIPGVGVVGMMLVMTVNLDPVRGTLLAAGVAGGGVALVWGLSRFTRRAPLLSAVCGTLLGGLLSRAVLLLTAMPGEATVLHPGIELVSELRPFRRSGTGSDGPPIVLLTIDTLRADRLVKMASWDRLASRGRWWDRAMTTSSWTLPSMASLATGLPVSGHGATAIPNGGFQGIRPGVPTLASELATEGYTCAAVFTSSWMSPEMGFSGGFHRFVHADQNRAHRLALAGAPTSRALSAHAVVDQAIREADHLPRRGGFLWVHFLDPHMPYAHAEGSLVSALKEATLREGKLIDDDAKAAIRTAYDHEVALLDVELMRLLDHLEATGLADGMVVLTADHGEEFWEHGGIEHGHSHHGEVTDVGMVVLAPGLPPGPGRGLASVLDTTSTARAVAGLPPRGFDLRTELPADRVATAWGNIFFRIDASARQANRRVIARGDGTVEVYDLSSDPTERDPQPPSAEDPLVQAALALIPPDVRGESEFNRAALEALGYLSP